MFEFPFLTDLEKIMLKSSARIVRWTAALTLVAVVSLAPSSADAGHVHVRRGPVGLHFPAGHHRHIHAHRHVVPYWYSPVYRPIVVGYYGPTYPIYQAYPTYPVYPTYPICIK